MKLDFYIAPNIDGNDNFLTVIGTTFSNNGGEPIVDRGIGNTLNLSSNTISGLESQPILI
ncbi:hypothetical protein [Scytonema sp. PCC 10023]|uniref:hypothetical protein n=1 Tax=Scytonema sp. PCC 10023 TaxID=1680591 RepID=UPI0039C725B6